MDVDQPDNDGFTPLHLASLHGIEDAVETLVRLGADPTKRDNNGCSAVHAASVSSNVEALKVLVTHSGVTTLLRSNDGASRGVWKSFAAMCS